MRSGNLEGALLLYEKIVSIDSTSEVLYVTKEALEGMQKKYDKAVLTAVRLTELKPNEPLYNLKAGALYERIGHPSNGRKYLDIAIIQCDQILDSLQPNNNYRTFYKFFKSISLLLIGNEVAGNKLLSELHAEEGNSPGSAALKYMNKSKAETLKIWLEEK